jgi:acyl carrier protein
MNTDLAPKFSSEILSNWLIQRVAYYLSKDISEIKTDFPLAEYGLDSVYAVSLCGDLEDFLSIYVEPTLAWDYPTIDEIVEFLQQELSETQA